MQARYFALIVAVVIFLFVVDLIRREKMTFRYALFWLSSCALVIILSLWEKLLWKVSALAGFELPSNFVFFLLLAFFTTVTLLLTLYINEQNSRTQSLAQSITRLEYHIKKLEKDAEGKKARS
jgi:hypothetical protein